MLHYFSIFKNNFPEYRYDFLIFNKSASKMELKEEVMHNNFIINWFVMPNYEVKMSYFFNFFKNIFLFEGKTNDSYLCNLIQLKYYKLWVSKWYKLAFFFFVMVNIFTLVFFLFLMFFGSQSTEEEIRTFFVHDFVRTYTQSLFVYFFIFLISAFRTNRLILTTFGIITFTIYVNYFFIIFAFTHAFTILFWVPLILIVLLAFSRRLSISVEQYFLYIQYALVNFFIIYTGSFFVLIAYYTFTGNDLINNQLTPLTVTLPLAIIDPFNTTFFLFHKLCGFMSFKRYLLIKDYFAFSQNFLFDFIFVIDDLGLIFMWLSFLLIVLCIYFLWSTMRNDKNFTLYVSQLLLLLVQLQLTFTAVNVFTFFLAFESLLIPMIIMIALWGSKNNRQANNYLIFYTMVSAIPMLLSILYLKSYNFDLIIFTLKYQVNSLTMTEKVIIWLSFFFAFAVKTPMVPVHIWLPKTHVDAPTVGSVILAGVLLKVGLIGILRFLFPLFPVLSHFFAPYVTAMATIGVIYASLITLRQIDAKRIIAYSSVAHMNMAVVSLFSLNMVGLYSTVYLMVSHGLIASGLFFLVGFVYNRFHVRSIYYYSGLATCMPVAAIYFFLFTLANMAFPLTSGFIGEFLLLLGISLNNLYLGVLNSLSMLLTTVYSVLLFGRMFLGELKPWLEQMVLNYIRFKIYHSENKSNKNVGLLSATMEEAEFKLDLYAYERNIANVLFFYIILLGIYPQYLFNIFADVGSFFYILLPLL